MWEYCCRWKALPDAPWPLAHRLDARMPDAADLGEGPGDAWSLETVSVRGFRSLSDCGPVVFSNSLTVLTGQNDGGKTSLLDAVAFLLGEFTCDDRDHRNPDDPIEVTGTFLVSGRSERVTVRAVRAVGTAVSRAMLDKVHAGMGAHPIHLPINQLRAAMTKLGIPGPGGAEKAPLVAAAETWVESRPPEEFSEMWVPIPQEVSSRLPGVQRFTSTTALAPDRYIAAFVEREVHRYLGDEPHEELERVLVDVRAKVASSVERLKAKILEHCPEFGDIGLDVRTDFTRPRVSVEMSLVDRTGRVFFTKEGEGMRRRMTLAIQEGELEALEAETTALSTIAMYDEPDTHLDYAAQRSLFDILERQSELPGVQVVVATHSRNFIDRAALEKLIHLRLDGERRTTVERLVEESHEAEALFLTSICAGLGLRNSVLLDERSFFVVEGETEEASAPRLFRACTGRSINAAGVQIVNTGGSGAIRRLVEVISVNWQRDVVLMTDSDFKPELESSGWIERLGLVEGTSLFFVGDREFEDAFSNDVWARALNGEFPPVEGPEWVAADIEVCRSAEKFSRAVLNEAKRRTRDNSVGKPDLGLALASSIDSDADIPEVVRLCLEAVLADNPA